MRQKARALLYELWIQKNLQALLESINEIHFNCAKDILVRNILITIIFVTSCLVIIIS